MPHTSEEAALVRAGGLAVFGEKIAIAQQVIAVTVPLAIGVVVPEHRSRLAGFVNHADLKIDFYDALKRLGNVVCRLEIGHDALITSKSGFVIMLLLVVSPDEHFLAGQMVTAEIDLELGVTCISRLRETGHHFLERVEGFDGSLLVALDLGNLLIIAERTQIIGIGSVRAGRMQKKITFELLDGKCILALQVVA